MTMMTTTKKMRMTTAIMMMPMMMMSTTIELMEACIQKKFTTVMMMMMTMLMPWMMMLKTIELMEACIQASWLLPSWWTSTQFNDHRRNYHLCDHNHLLDHFLGAFCYRYQNNNNHLRFVSTWSSQRSNSLTVCVCIIFRTVSIFVFYERALSLMHFIHFK